MKPRGAHGTMLFMPTPFLYVMERKERIVASHYQFFLTKPFYHTEMKLSLSHLPF